MIYYLVNLYYPFGIEKIETKPYHLEHCFENKIEAKLCVFEMNIKYYKHKIKNTRKDKRKKLYRLLRKGKNDYKIYRDKHAEYLL